MKVKNNLLNFSNIIIYQDDEYFKFSLDSVLLANFVTLRLSDKNIIDLCSGNAPIPMLLSFRTKARIFGVEIQEYIYKLGYDSIVQNNLLNQITLINKDIKLIGDLFSPESFDVVTCNPPYFKYNENNLINEFSGKALARHEIMVNLDDVFSRASYLLKSGGTFAIVHRPERMLEIFDLMRQYKIEPKKIQFVYSKINKNSNTILIEGTKNGKSGIKVLNPLVIYNDKGEYMSNIKKMFGCDSNVAK